MYHLMLSRAQYMEQIYVENFTNIIKANEKSLIENENLVQRSIVPSFQDKCLNIFMVNIQSLENKTIDLSKDIYATKADHICIVETWLNPKKENNLRIDDRVFTHASQGRGKGIGIFSLTSRKFFVYKTVVKEKYQMISIVDKTIPEFSYQLILMYISSNCAMSEVVQDLKLMFIKGMKTNVAKILFEYVIWLMH